MNIADRIQNLRKTKNISQEELADKVGVSRQAVSKWESGQSTPDIDKMILLSDYFEISTDYLLKGIESEGQTKVKTDANIFTLIATAVNFIGLIVSCVIVYEEQDPVAVAIGVIVFAVGSTIFGIGQVLSNKNLVVAKRAFWMINIWILTFVPLSALYNVLLSLPFAPFPLIPDKPFAFPAFWVVYIAICLCVVFLQIKSSRKRINR